VPGGGRRAPTEQAGEQRQTETQECGLGRGVQEGKGEDETGRVYMIRRIPCSLGSGTPRPARRERGRGAPASDA